MIINDIEYALRLWVDNENGEFVCDEVFSSFADMNVFLKAAMNDRKYDGLTAQFSPVEVINGQPEEAIRYVYDIFPIMDLEPDEIEDYYSYFEEDFRASREAAEEAGKDTLFTPKEDDDDYESKKKHRHEITYICPYCFREIEDCRCESYPWYLVQIDTPIVPIIRILNKKGYITTACCSGHIEEDHCVSIYIAFRDEHNFGTNIPRDSAYSKHGRTISYNGLDMMSVEERKVFRKECIEKIAVWAENLPSLG